MLDLAKVPRVYPKSGWANHHKPYQYPKQLMLKKPKKRFLYCRTCKKEVRVKEKHWQIAYALWQKGKAFTHEMFGGKCSGHVYPHSQEPAVVVFDGLVSSK